MKQRTQDRLQVMVCLSCEQMPANERHTVVKATDGEFTQFIKFGRYQSIKSIMQSVPMHFMDRMYDERRNKRKSARSA